MKNTHTVTLLLILSFFSQEVIGKVIRQSDSISFQQKKEEVSIPVQNNFTLSTRLTSNYIWRDAISNYSAIQPSAGYTFGNSGFSFNFWSNYGTNSKTNDLEIATTVSYSHALSDQSNIFFGYIHYLAPILEEGVNENSQRTYNEDTNSSEVMLGVSFPFHSLNISQTNFFSNTRELYSNLGIGKQFNFYKNQQFTVNTSLGYRAGSSSTDEGGGNGFRDLVFSLSYPIQTKHTTFNVYISSTHILKTREGAYQLGIDFTFK